MRKTSLTNNVVQPKQTEKLNGPHLDMNSTQRSSFMKI